MSGIATLLAERGWPVAGSDARGSGTLDELGTVGVRCAVGHRAENLDLLPGGPTAVIVSTAIRPDNPEVRRAQQFGVPVVRRAEALAALMAGARSVCVAGTHGKTSTTSMLTVALHAAGLDPSYAIGGVLAQPASDAVPDAVPGAATGLARAAHSGTGDVFVAEADESDGSFLAFAPHGAIVTNLEPDHLDHHGTAEAYAAVFDAFTERIQPGGFLVVCADDPGADALAGRTGGERIGGARVVRYGTRVDGPFPPEVRVTVDPTGSAGPGTDQDGARTGAAGTVRLADGREVALRLAVPGEHMLLNATAALVAGIELGVDPYRLAEGLAAYRGVRRRFERRGTAGGVTVYDDYAHHPTEVRAQLRAARAVVPAGGRLVVVFQPHLYSRTAAFAGEFATALRSADVVVVLDVYGAREEPVPGVSGELIARSVPTSDAPAEGVGGPGGTRTVRYEPDFAVAARTVAGLVRSGDLVITMGAGDVTTLGPELLTLLGSR
ncbi:UDP-N-acetylmuramate--L-alanine ligase [Nakamurella leprariae]|uniref:UDP-N-acetylmuramate--L-alanine ligase n=2 Tax=Nakamurella leprariae TaxID=2803911 RepID=A0A938YJ53_9ACTN|nr:UDP-N-acetylmuramate--L-alanine ligase [Nakamurella leprariae]